MSKLQVLVTTMHQNDFSKYYSMNLQTDAVIANQADEDYTLEQEIKGYTVKLVTTNTRGTSKNRNTAAKYISDTIDFITFSDDDVTFVDNYAEIISNEFKNHPQADAIRFNLHCKNTDREFGMAGVERFHRVSRREATPWGVCGLVIKKDVFLNNQLTFDERFGPGTENYCGEDSIFIQQLFKKKVTVYASPFYIAEVAQTESTWFDGITEKRFIVAGMLLHECYPWIAHILSIRSAYKMHRRYAKEGWSFRKILSCYWKGNKKNRLERKMIQDKEKARG